MTTRGRRHTAAVAVAALLGGAFGMGPGAPPAGAHTCIRILTTDIGLIPPGSTEPCTDHGAGTHTCIPLDSLIIVCVELL